MTGCRVNDRLTRVLASFPTAFYGPAMPRPPLPIPLTAFAVRVADIGDAWLELRCCAGVTLVPIRTLGDQAATLGAILTRLRCRSCRQSPRSVALVGRADQDAAQQTGTPTGWQVELTGRG
jgi:hypothetical protein